MRLPHHLEEQIIFQRECFLYRVCSLQPLKLYCNRLPIKIALCLIFAVATSKFSYADMERAHAWTRRTMSSKHCVFAKSCRLNRRICSSVRSRFTVNLRVEFCSAFWVLL